MTLKEKDGSALRIDPMNADLINAYFELFGGLFIWINVLKIAKDRKVRGVHWLPTFAFTIWCFWNVFYYQSLGQYFSTFAAIVPGVGNFFWLSLCWKYRNA